MFKSYSMELAGRMLTLETGKMAGLANGSVLVRYGDTVVIVNVTASKEPREGVDFFPLSVDYEERMYAAGKIPGSFTKREGKPSDKAILVSRAIDRPIRPLFPKDLRNDVCVNAMVLCVDLDCSPEVAAQIGTSAALSISDIPFNGPTAAVSVGYVDGKIVINPTLEQRERNRLNLTVAGTKEKVSMIEAGADEIPDDLMLEAIMKGHEEIKKIAEFIEGIQKEIGKPKFTYESCEVDHDFYEIVEKYAKEKMYNALQEPDKETRENNIANLQKEVEEFLQNEMSEENFEKYKGSIGDAMYKLEKKTVRYMILEEHKRVDGRTLDDIRPLSAEIDILPRTHGSALFSRGQTQVLSVATLGTIGEEQELDGLDEEESKRYIHHYNFPPYSIGEARPSRGPGRREIGHGALAERALAPVIPSQEEFPYTNICVWNPQIIVPFMLHIPNLNLLIVEIERIGMEPAFNLLQKKVSERRVIFNPSSDDYARYVSGFPSIIVKPLISQSPLVDFGGINMPRLEKVIVDISGDVEFGFAQGAELYTIFDNLLSSFVVNLKSLYRYADRRARRSLVENIVKTCEP